jgi:hypothetical protein
MNGTDPEPLSPDVVDELLSAELDGEFDAAALELGLDPATAHARLAATRGSEERRVALANARAFVASDPGDALDDVTRRRLVSRALDLAVVHQTEPHPAGKWITRLGVWVAAAAALAGVIVLLGHLGSSNSAKDSTARVAAPASASSTVAPKAVENSSAPGAVASVDSSAQLTQFVQRLLQSKQPAPQKEAGVSATPTTRSIDRQSELDARQKDEAFAPAGTCADRVAQALKAGSSPIASAALRYHGAPASLVVFRTAKGSLAVVYNPSTCTVVSQQLIK